MNDPFNLSRFIEAQAPVYKRVYDELHSGSKRSHWMWFVFPQIAGLGYSAMAQRYAISGRAEAAAYAQHPVLGARLRGCTELVLAVEERTANQIFGSPDDLKFRSSMTLFSLCAGDPDVFREALDKYFQGEPDQLTIERLSG